MAQLRTRELGGVAVTGAGVTASAGGREVQVPVPVTVAGYSYGPGATPPGPRNLGRRGWRGAPAAGPAAGGGMITADARGAAPAHPGHGGGDAGTGLQDGERVIIDRAAYPSRARTPAFQNGKLIARDRHIQENTGRTTWGSDPNSQPGLPNPEADGPARPAARMIDRTLSWQIGTDATAYLDNDGYHAVTSAGGRAYPLGTQGDPWTRVSGGTPGLYRPYGSRGGRGTEGPEPSVYALPGDGSGLRPGTLLSQGAPGDGPQDIYGGVPHGLHTATLPPLMTTQARYRNTPQQVQPETMRPANSKIAGQSYSQTVVHLDGTGGGAPPGMATGRQPGMNSRFRSTS